MSQGMNIATLIILAILPAFLAVHAEPSTVNIAISKDSIGVNMSILLKENLTSLPLLNSSLNLSNASAIVQPLLQPFTVAIQKTVPSASITSLALRVRSSNSSQLWTLEENYSMIISGAITNSGSNIRTNLGFISMNLDQSLPLGDKELNAVGPTFLLPALSAISAQYTNLQYFIDGSQTRNEVIPAQTTKTFWLFDLTWIPAVSSWTEKSDVLGQSTSWSFNPAGPRYNLTLGLPSPEGLFLAKYVAIYQLSMAVTVPGNAWASGNIVYFDLTTPSEVVMPVVAAGSLILLLALFVVDRRLGGPFHTRKKRPLKQR